MYIVTRVEIIDSMSVEQLYVGGAIWLFHCQVLVAPIHPIITAHAV